jgi:L-threonylcarbamoyladenylate synthase
MTTAVIEAGGDLSPAAEALRAGGVVAVPTETVYGLCCDGLNARAIARLFELKGRPRGKPIALLVSGAQQAERLCARMPDAAHALARAFWPGPLTIVLAGARGTPDILSAGTGTIGLRCPDCPPALRLIGLAGVPLAAPSCNPSGERGAASAREALEYFGGRIECVVDGGARVAGGESTVVSVTDGGVALIRAGAIAFDEILEAV